MKQSTRTRRIGFGRSIAQGAIMLGTVMNLSTDRAEFQLPGESPIMSEAEREYLAKLKTRIHDDGQKLLKFSHRLRDK